MFFTSSFSFVGVTIVSKDAEALSRRQAPLVCLRLFATPLSPPRPNRVPVSSQIP